MWATDSEDEKRGRGGINANPVADAIAGELEGEKLVLLIDVIGVKDKQGIHHLLTVSLRISNLRLSTVP